MKKGLVSIVIPVFNRSSLIKEAVMSCLLQSYVDIEVIIINDGSTDETAKVIDTLKLKWVKTIRVIHQDNVGAGGSRQRGTDKAYGEFVQYLDSDDILMEDKLVWQVEKINEDNGSDICYALSYESNHSFHPPLLAGPMRLSGNSRNSLFPELLNQRWWTTSSPLYRKSVIERIDPWLDLKNEEDWVFDACAGALKSRVCWVAREGSIRRINITRDHLSYGGYIDKEKLRDRIYAKKRIFQCAKQYGLTSKDKEMELFSRECFFLARQAGGLGMEDESRKIFQIARSAGGTLSLFNPRFATFGLMGQLVGWNNGARITRWLRGKM